MIDAIILLATALLESVYMASSALDALFFLVMAVTVVASFTSTFAYVGVEWLSKNTKKELKSIISNWAT